jgi:membrane-associated phospholipid phosphatase
MGLGNLVSITPVTLACRRRFVSHANSTAAWSTPRVSLLTDDRARVRLALVAVVCLLGFVAIAALVRSGATDGIDTAGLDVLARFHGTPLDPLFVAISELGVADILAFFSVIPAGFLWVAGARRAAAFVVVGYLAAAIASDAIKAAMPLARPPASYQIALKMPESEDLLWIGFAIVLVIAFWRTRWRWGAVIGGVLFAIALFWDPTPLSTPGLDSFPSGHAFRSIVLVSSLLFALPAHLSRRAMLGLAIVVILIGVSRVYLGEHHPTDVVAGWLAGASLVCALSLIPVFRAREEIALPRVLSRDTAAGRM